MEPNRLEYIKKLFAEALLTDHRKRKAFLQEASAGDPDIIAEVTSLLHSYENSDDFLEKPLTVEAGLMEDIRDPMIGKEIGNYTIDALAGMGGSGAVYLGRRNDKVFEKRVAIKILKFGITSEYLLKRFRIERQTLASLQHQNITRLIDGGRTESGLPYLIMEFVDGTPITEYCRAKNLNVLQKINLFRQVCEAVHYAHQSLIIHRDIKPGNIMVTDKGIPKLMDFGIAKIIDDELTQSTVKLTMTGMWHLTPEYASPEQVNGETITTASDIYSLGALFYEILTGQQPIKIDGYSPVAISKAVTEFNVKKPSEKVLEADHSQKISKVLKGDLDNIVLKAMHKDPNQRYASVQEFNEDLHRYQEGLPVVARRDSIGYKTGKFIKRHKVGVSLFIAIQLLIIASVFLITKQRNIAQRERDKAKIEAAKSEAVNNFLLDMLSSADPTTSSREIKVYDLLEKAASDVEENFAGQPEINAAVKYTLGSTFTGLGEFDRAEKLLLETHEANKTIYGKSSQEVAESAHQLALCYDYKGEFLLSDSLYRVSLGIFGNLPGKPTVNLANALNDYGSMHTNLGNLDSAAVMLKQSLDIYSANGLENDVKYANNLNNLAVVYHHQFKIDEAEKYYRQALDLLGNLPGSYQAQIGSMRNNLAFIYLDKGDFVKSEQEFIEANKIKKSVYGPDHSNLALGYTNLGMLLYIMEKYEKADSVLHEAIAVFERNGMANDPVLALAFYWLGRVYLNTGQLQESENILKRSLAIREATLPEGNFKIWSVKGELGVCYTKQQQLDKAGPLLLGALDFFNREENYNEKKVERYSEFAEILKEKMNH